MARSMAPRLALSILFTGANGFAPFAGVEELRPQRLRDFCSEEAEVGMEGHTGLRRCQQSIRRKLEDGGDLEFSWSMRADPDGILSLDTEAEHGVQMISCDQKELELELPESHLKHAAPGKVVVGSHFVHGCQHLAERHLYHRIVEVQKRKLSSGGAGRPVLHRVRLSTEDLPNFAHIVPDLSFSFSYMPVEARDIVPHPEMRTDYGLNRAFLEKRRRLMSPFDFLKKLAQRRGVQTEDGGFQHGGHSSGAITTPEGMLNFMPKQISNFGWNWDFFMNTTEEPDFEIVKAGLKGVVKLRKPYIKVHSGIFLNFTSEFSGFLGVPKVKWQAGMHGHGHVQGRVLAVLNTTAAAGVDPFDTFDLRALANLERPQWFQKIEFATGSVPVSFEPGFQFQAKMYHQGTFHGAVAFGGHTHGIVSPMLSFDSKKGFDLEVKGTLLDTEIIPPFWMIFTKRFEMGLVLKPSLLMRGDFAGLEKATMAIEMRPYLNLTIRRDGDHTSAKSAETRALTVYPYRVMGITDVQFQKKYKVRIDVLGEVIESSAVMNWGEVMYHDHISKFRIDGAPESSITGQPVKVTLFEVDDSTAVPTEKPIGSGEVTCTSLLNGECHPSPPIVHIKDGSMEIADVELAILWQDNPEPWFASKIRGTGMSFPQLVLRKDALARAFPSAVKDQDSQLTQELSIHLVHGGRTYTVPIQGSLSTLGATLHGDTVVEFGPNFLETWLPCSAAAGPKCESPRLELYYGAKQVAVANVPQIEWTSETAMQGTRGFMATSLTLNVPCTVALYAPGSMTTTIAVVTMNAKVVSPASASMVFEPTSAAQAPLEKMQRLAWTVSDVDTASEYSFELSPLQIVSVPSSQQENFVTYRKVNSLVLRPIPNHTEAFTMKCKSTAIAGMSAEQAPCSFTHDMMIGLGFAVGDQLVVRIQWSKDGEKHEIYSPPFAVVPKISARRLLEPHKEVVPTTPPRHLFSKERWNNRVGQHQGNCDTKDLHFNLGAGMLFRGRVDNVGVPEGFPMIGGLDEAPKLTTGFRRIAAIKPGTDAQDLLPEAFCKGGLCKGALPGCTQANFKTFYFAKLILNYSRPYHYSENRKGKFHGLMKEVLAFAFSTLPEAVDVLIKELNRSHTAHRTSTVRPVMQPTQPPLPALTTAIPLPSTPAEEDNGAFRRWWSGASRRLSYAPRTMRQQPEGWMEREQANLEDHQVLLYFREGTPFKIDRPLVEQMLQNGYFMNVEDDVTAEQGPLRITSFYLDEGAPRGDPSRDGVKAVFLPYVQNLAMMSAIVLTACSAVALLLRRTRRCGLEVAFPRGATHASGGYALPGPSADDARDME